MVATNRIYLQIGEVAERIGVTQRALRFYEEKGLLTPPIRMEGGFRLYTEEDVQRVELIKKLQNLLGISLSEIREMIEAEEVKAEFRSEYRRSGNGHQLREKLERAIAVTEGQIHLIDQKLDQLGQLRDRFQQKLAHYQQLRQELEDQYT